MSTYGKFLEVLIEFESTHQSYPQAEDWMLHMNEHFPSWKKIISENYDELSVAYIKKGNHLYPIFVNVLKEKLAILWITESLIYMQKSAAYEWLLENMDEKIWDQLPGNVKTNMILKVFDNPGFPLNEIKRFGEFMVEGPRDNGNARQTEVAFRQLAHMGFIPSDELSKITNAAKKCSDSESLSLIHEKTKEVHKSLKRFKRIYRTRD